MTPKKTETVKDARMLALEAMRMIPEKFPELVPPSGELLWPLTKRDLDRVVKRMRLHRKMERRLHKAYRAAERLARKGKLKRETRLIDLLVLDR